MSNFSQAMVDGALANSVWTELLPVVSLISIVLIFVIGYRQISLWLKVHSWEAENGYRNGTFGRHTKKYYDEGGE